MFPLNLSCQSLIHCNIKIYMITLIVILNNCTIQNTLLLKLKNDCNTQSCLLLNLKVIVLYKHVIVKIQNNHIIVKTKN